MEEEVEAIYVFVKRKGTFQVVNLDEQG